MAQTFKFSAKNCTGVLDTVLMYIVKFLAYHYRSLNFLSTG